MLSPSTGQMLLFFVKFCHNVWLKFIRSEQDKEPEHEATCEAVVSGPSEEAATEGMQFTQQNKGLLLYICYTVFDELAMVGID